MNKVYVIGMGPGAYEQMTVKAVRTLEKCDVIVGYTVYIELLKEYFPDKRYLTTSMRQEAARCRMAFEEAAKGAVTAMVCSGDAGIYGMAGLMYEIGEEYPEVAIEVIPGVTAALGGSAVLGAAVGHDVSLISLSDLLTPWELIEERLRCAAKADFVICLYNPSSRKRSTYLAKACEIMLEYKAEDTVCGIVKNIAREGETMQTLTLKELKETTVDMFSTVFIGNKQTKVIREKWLHQGDIVYERQKDSIICRDNRRKKISILSRKKRRKTARLCGNRLWGESASGREEYNGDTRPDGQWADGRVYEGV